MKSCTCFHLIHTVEEVVWGAGDAVTAHAQAAVCAFVSGVICPAAERKTIDNINFDYAKTQHVIIVHEYLQNRYFLGNTLYYF